MKMRGITSLSVCLWTTLLTLSVSETVPASQRGSWASCQGAICSEVQRQAEGLTRLKLLRNYVVQTIQLMDSMVTSMDEELVKTGQGLSIFIGPNCKAAHSLLKHVTTTNVSVDRFNSATIRNDLEVSESRWPSTQSSLGDVPQPRDDDWPNVIEESSDTTGSDFSETHETHFVEQSSSGGTSITFGDGHSGSGSTSGPFGGGHSGSGGSSGSFGGGHSGSGGSSGPFGGGHSGSGGSSGSFGGGHSGSGGSSGSFGGGHSGSGGSSGSFGGGYSGSASKSEAFAGSHSGSGSTSGSFGGSHSGSGSTSGSFGGGHSGSGSTSGSFGGGHSGSGSTSGSFGGGHSASGGSSWSHPGSEGSEWSYGGGYSGLRGSGDGSKGQGPESGGGQGVGPHSGSKKPWAGGKKPGGGKSIAGAGCRGVGKESDFWVPGLDAWCEVNCAAGFCPVEQCVC